MIGLTELRSRGVIDGLDLHLARTLGRLASENDDSVLLGVALASRATRMGHVCLELDDTGGLVDDQGDLVGPFPTASEWARALRASSLVIPQDQATPDLTRSLPPLVLEADSRLYLGRYWDYQQQLSQQLLARATITLEPNLEAVAADLDQLFGPVGEDPDLQRVAAASATLRRLSVISGGPGTGKTTTVLRMLALLQASQRAKGDRALRIDLLAPTGKAAARLSESILSGLGELPPELAEDIPTETSTIHRRLGFQHATPTRFRYNATNPLPTDLVVVDEASMVDLSLMARLVQAIPPHARLVLLGDRDQLASVEAGAILGDICNTGGELLGPSPDFERLLDRGGAGPLPERQRATHSGLSDCIVHLTRSWRFGADSGIRALAESINQGAGERAVRLVQRQEGDFLDLDWLAIPGPRSARELLQDRIIAGYRAMMTAREPADALAAFSRFRILCAHRAGEYGVRGLNALVRELLANEGWVDEEAEWFHGRPVMVTANDYEAELFNGDVGLTLKGPDGRLRVYFPHAPAADGVRRVHPGRLPPHETVFAMTVHKSQGSEFDEVLLVLSDRVTRVLTRELLYTGVTRARKRVSLVGTEAVLKEAVGRRVRRASGLRHALWGANPSDDVRSAGAPS